jgi:predicted dinucleotide-binding enzyme
MRIAILGSGNMGSTLGRLFASAGHTVTYSFSRDPAKLERLARSSGARARAASPADAVRDADVAVLAVLWQQVSRVLRSAGSLRGKVLIDCTNPLTPSDDALAVGHRVSGAEIIARRARGALVVKAFNTTPVELLRAGVDVLAEQPAVCYCGDDARAKRVAARLIRQLGFEPVNCGALASARYLEPLAMLVGELAYNQGRRPEVGLRFLRAGRRGSKGSESFERSDPSPEPK